MEAISADFCFSMNMCMYVLVPNLILSQSLENVRYVSDSFSLCAYTFS